MALESLIYSGETLYGTAGRGYPDNLLAVNFMPYGRTRGLTAHRGAANPAVCVRIFAVKP